MASVTRTQAKWSVLYLGVVTDFDKWLTCAEMLIVELLQIRAKLGKVLLLGVDFGCVLLHRRRQCHVRQYHRSILLVYLFVLTLLLLS